MLAFSLSVVAFSPHAAPARALKSSATSVACVITPHPLYGIHAGLEGIFNLHPCRDETDAKQTLLDLCAATKNAGVDAGEERRTEMRSAIRALEPNCPPQPARMPLSGATYDLIFSTAPNGPNGKCGPLIGDVTQEFVDERTFYNAITLFGGALRIALRAERDVIDDQRILVAFKETSLALFGRTVLRRPTTAGGVWEQRYVDDDLRVFDVPAVMNAARVNQGMIEQPATFILRKRAAPA